MSIKGTRVALPYRMLVCGEGARFEGDIFIFEAVGGAEMSQPMMWMWRFGVTVRRLINNVLEPNIFL